MNKKLGRNDPCHCGSKKKYKQCCFKKDNQPRKLTAKWINQPSLSHTDLIKRAFQDKIPESDQKKD